ncbi:penicillin-binding transpeptidase domain-containing protein, partial [Aeromonas taiwanensis]|uniref:penicillin-binding transpeptidase domain-containing protein n=1 Tax=Aeromonas taiwanensis TaxID=633417 RepID=UPI00248D5AB4
YSGGFQGYITLREALRQSRNLATINLLNEIGLDTAYKKLSEMGFGAIPKNLSIALGSFGISPLEFAKFYSIFPNGGEIVEPSLIKRIINYQNLEAVFEPERTFVTEPEQAYLMMQRNLATVESGMADSDNTRQILFKVEEAIDQLADMVQQVADATCQLSRTLGHTTDKVSDISLQAQTGEQEAQECLQLASSLHQASQQQQRLLSQFRV